MLARLAGDPQAEAALKSLKGRTVAFRKESFKKW